LFQVLRPGAIEEAELFTITHFDSIEAIRAFAGEDDELANIAPAARRLLSRFNPRCDHYRIVLGLGDISPEPGRVKRDH
jgi:hypothetical protein